MSMNIVSKPVKKETPQKRLLLIIVLLVLLAGCASQTPVPLGTSETLAPLPVVPMSSTILPHVSYSDLTVISPTNANQVTLLDRWGKGHVFDMDISPDGTSLIVSTSTGIYLFDIETGTEKALSKNFTDHWIPIDIDDGYKPSALSYSPDGKYLAVAYSSHDLIVIWNLAEDRIEKQFDTVVSDSYIKRIAFSQDSKQIIVKDGGIFYDSCDCFGGTFQIYTIPQGEMVYYRQFRSESSISYFRVGTNGTVFFTGHHPGPATSHVMTVVEAATGKVLETLTTKSNDMILDVQGDGSLIAVHAYRDGKSFTDLMDPSTKKIRRSIEGNALFLPASDHFLTQDQGSDSTWSLKDSNNTICAFDNGKVQMALSMWGAQSEIKIRKNLLAVWANEYEEIQIWDTENCQIVRTIPFLITGSSLEFSPDGKTIATSSYSYIHLWDTDKRRIRQSLSSTEKPRPLRFFTFNPSSTQIIASTREEPYSLTFLDSETGEHLKTLNEYGQFLGDLAISPDGSKIATIDAGGLRLWDTNRERIMYTSDQFDYINITDLFFSPGSTQLAVFLNQQAEDEIILLDVASGQISKHVALPDSSKVAFSPNWKHLAIASTDGRIHLWLLENEAVLHTLVGHQQITSARKYTYLDDMTFSPDEELLISVDNNQIRFWDVQTGMFLAELTPRFTVQKVDFSPDGCLMATIGADNTIHIWGVQP